MGNNNQNVNMPDEKLRHLAQAFHSDFPLFHSGQQAHNGRLDNRHQRHVAIRGHRDWREQMRRELV